MRTATAISIGLLVLLCQLSQPESTPQVTFDSAGSTAFRAVIEVAIQTKQPLAIELGKDLHELCEFRHPFNIRNEGPTEALIESLQGTNYSVREKDGVLMVVAPDLTSWQQVLLEYRYKAYSGGTTATTMAGLGTRLTGWMQMEVGRVPAFAGSIRSSPSAPKFRMDTITDASTEEIANRIVKMDSKGIWILRPTIEIPSGPADEEIAVYSYNNDLDNLNHVSCHP